MTDLVRYLMIREGLSHRMYWYIKSQYQYHIVGEREEERDTNCSGQQLYSPSHCDTLISVSVWTRAPPAQSRHSFNSGLILGNDIVKYLQPIVVHYSAVQSCVGLRERERERERDYTLVRECWGWRMSWAASQSQPHLQTPLTLLAVMSSVSLLG